MHCGIDKEDFEVMHQACPAAYQTLEMLETSLCCEHTG